MTKSVLAGLLLLTFSTIAHAGKVKDIEIDNDIVYFTTSTDKTEPSPTCVIRESKEKWSLNITTPSGREQYTLLMLAMSTGLNINVETAGDCAFVDGVERAKRIWVEK